MKQDSLYEILVLVLQVKTQIWFLTSICSKCFSY